MKTTTICFIALTLCAASLHAQKSTAAPWTHFTEANAQSPDALVKIFSNLGPSTMAYIANGYYVAGPLSALGSSQFIALPFKPAMASHAMQLRAAVAWNSLGANQVNLSLYNDASGVPGTKIAGPVTVKSLPTFGTCCKVAAGTITSTALTAATQYWIVADTPATGTGSDSEDVWNAVNQLNIAGNVAAGGWFAFAANLIPAGAVYGSIP